MSYSSGNLIVATDYMAFRGDPSPNTAYANDIAAQGKLTALIGIGYGTRGYGVTSTTFPAVTSNTSVATSTQWNNLRSVMSTINTHTGIGLTLQLPQAKGDLIVANDGTGSTVDISSLITSLDNNRLLIDISQQSVSVALTSSRTTSWVGTLTHEFTATFGTEDLARYFFNTGGQIRTAGSRSGGAASGPNTAITNLLVAVGTVKIQANTTTYTGSGGTVANIGYYTLTDTWQDLFSHTGSGPYANVSYTVRAKRESYVGLNGANGSVVRCQVLLALGSYPGVNISGTTVSTISSMRSTNAVTVSNPTYATVTGF